MRVPRKPDVLERLRRPNAGRKIKAAVAGVDPSAVPDATSSTKGKLKLTNHLGGTADAPTVPGLQVESDARAAADLAVLGALTIHGSDTTSVHGIADTSDIILEGDSRLTDQRTPSNNSVTSAKIVDGSIVDADVNSAADIAQSKIEDLPSDLAAKADSSDSRFPSSGEKSALAGTDGTPGSGNKYVTNSDSRNSNARTPTSHSVSHKDGGSDQIRLNELADPDGPVDFGGEKASGAADAEDVDDLMPWGQFADYLGAVITGVKIMPPATVACDAPLDSYMQYPGAIWSQVGSLPYPNNLEGRDMFQITSSVFDFPKTTIDGVEVNSDPYTMYQGKLPSILLMGETDAEKNGLYISAQLMPTAQGAWDGHYIRADGMNNVDQAVASGAWIPVLLGDDHGGHAYYLVTENPTIGTTDLDFDEWPMRPSDHGADHLPGGTDALTTAAAGTIQPDDTAATGTATSFARSDHRHAIAAATAGTIQPDDTAAEGSATSFARSDHRHAIAAATAGTIQPDDTAAEGSSTSFARADHRHAIAAAAASSITGANAEGSSTSFARADHNHAVNLEGTQKDCGADLTVGTSASDLNNLTYTVGETGTYLVTFNLDVRCTSTGGVIVASLNVNGSDVRSAVLAAASATANQNTTPVSLTRRMSVSAGQVIKVRAIRVGGGYTIEADNSSMTVQRVA